MDGKSIKNLAFYSLILLLALTSLTVAGGFQLAVEPPPATAHPELKGAVLVVRTFGCHKPTDASVSGTAEGIINGQRQTLPVKLEPTSTGVYAIKQQWPNEGTWVLAISGSYAGLNSSALVTLAANGKAQIQGIENGKKLPVRVVSHKLTAKEIDEALKAASENLPLPQFTASAPPVTSASGTWAIASLGAAVSLIGFVALRRRRRPRNIS